VASYINSFFENLSVFIFYYALLISSPLSQLLILTLTKLVVVLIAVAYFTIAERKAMASIQRRKGPNVVGF
jgi:NADH:ubiquinone oxidoreductase subunit H